MSAVEKVIEHHETKDAELLPPEPYDFEFIVNALGLIPYQALDVDEASSFHGALNPGAIINFEITESGYGAFTLHGGGEVLMNGDQLAAFEKTLKQKIAEAQTKAREAMLAMQGGVQPGMIVGAPQGRRFRQ